MPGYCRVSYLFLCIGIFACTNNSGESQNERTKTMNNQSDWIVYLQQQTASKNDGVYQAHDKHNRAIIIEYKILNVQSPEFNDTMHSIADIAAQAFTAVEMQFLQKHPEAIATEALYKQYASLIQNGIADWQAIEKMVYETIHHLYTKTDWSKFDVNDIYIFAVAKDKTTGTQLGYITFFIQPSYPFGTCKVIAMGIVPAEQNCGLGKLLMSLIFKIVPQIQRIFLSTRITNIKAWGAYQSWGFTQDLNPVQQPGHTFNPDYWIFLKYKADNVDMLQTIAKMIG
ncbi:MAG: GNAT family N-acetyltransferase [Legionellales bacterium]